MPRHGLLPGLLRPLPRRRRHRFRGGGHPHGAPGPAAPQLRSRPHHPPQARLLRLARIRAPLPHTRGDGPCSPRRRRRAMLPAATGQAREARPDLAPLLPPYPSPPPGRTSRTSRP
ncbi:hypothetical protein PVAP13_1NG512819 [Panicum virgatum]|uniref:Uncharacterized protein n=1 Tax=Panicum virgatum TaxID=38727 RepID=A0A8T0XGN9_PANVG|nr:hypothetical protein PVAP13_1NG512819 [Panicum virgatum]